MKFEKGNKMSTGRPKGSKDKRTLQWEALGEYLCNKGSERFLSDLQSKDSHEFSETYLKILEYFKPKRARLDNTGEIDHHHIVEWKK